MAIPAHTEPLRLPDKSEIEEARNRISGFAVRTPLIPLYLNGAPSNIYLKLENLQPLGSFKIRAASNAIQSLPKSSFAKGVVTASAGNFGQGLAHAARLMNLSCTAIVPDTAAQTKINSMERLGARIIRVKFEDWWHVLQSRETPGVEGTFIHPVAEQAVIEGNATIGAEILEDLPEAQTVYLPVGGGGLASGVGAALKGQNPDIRVFAAESEMSAPVSAALEAGRPVRIDHKLSFIDGMGGQTVLEEIWPLLQHTVDGAVISPLDDIAAAVRTLMEAHHVVAEGAGAASVAAALSNGPSDAPTVCIISGGNIDLSVLCRIMQGHTP